ncbi:MAG: T9SS type A sorting domain-containing protein [Candidatus Latescibacteria bacterium]|nr:T9SS type A sorting domain-containing protein [Candidatus Latescibacterota bacterium]
MCNLFRSIAFWILAGALGAIPGLAQDDADYAPGTLTPNIDLGLQQVAVEVPVKYRGTVPEGLTLNLPAGFSASIFAADLGSPRHIEFSPEGVLHVVLRSGQVIALPDRDQDGVADEHVTVLDNLRVSDSIDFYKGDMYVGEENQVVRAIDADGDGVYEDREVFIDDLPWEAWHDTKTIVFDAQNDKLYVGVGSPCDLCRMEPGHQFEGGSTSNPLPFRAERGTVLEFNADGTGKRIFARGVRNVVGMDLHPVTNELWGTNNGHDLEGRSRPPEWIDVLRDGDFQGYPFVQSHQVWNDFSIGRYQPMLPITREDTLLAMSQKKPVALVPAHWAPMRIHFYTASQFPEKYRNAAFVAFHAGKAKLSSHPGYKVQALFSDPDGAHAQMADFITGFQTGTTTSDVWGYPHGVTSDAEGSLYVSSDANNRVIIKISHSLLHGSWEHNLPASVGLASRVDLRATVRIEQLAADGAEPRVTADLSALGGPAEVTLSPVGNNEYALEAQVVAQSVGPHTIAVRVEQEAGGRIEVLRLVGGVDVLPPSWRHDLPAAIVLGAAADLSATVHIEQLVADGAVPRVTADLSALGGPVEVELVPEGADDYALRAVVDADEAGDRQLLIRFQQEVDGVIYAHEFLHPVVVAPPDLRILDDELSQGWQVRGVDGAEVLGTTAEGPVYNGRQVLALRVQPENFFSQWSVEWQPPTAIDTFGFVGVRFALHTGAATVRVPAALSLVIDELSVDLLREPYLIEAGHPEWQIVEVPFEDFRIVNIYRGQEDFVVKEIGSIHLRGTLRGPLYMDDVRLVTSIPAPPPTVPTAVLETSDDTTPGEFALGPSYPNPFNAETLIRFRLPVAATARLSVYNLAGQRVADLLAGHLAAGAHQMHWDGRGAAGVDLATGVYFVRLAAGLRIATEKMLLLR